MTTAPTDNLFDPAQIRCAGGLSIEHRSICTNRAKMTTSATGAVRKPRRDVPSDEPNAKRHTAALEADALRRAVPDDLEELTRLEKTCFEPWRQDSRRSIRLSLSNHRHEIWVVPSLENGRLAAAIFLRMGRASVRTYSIAVDPSRQGRGLGDFLMRLAWRRASAHGISRLTLEADAARPSLLAWYEKLGFERQRLLEDFYERGRHAWRMVADSTGKPPPG